jgi:hypothetical protein
MYIYIHTHITSPTHHRQIWWFHQGDHAWLCVWTARSTRTHVCVHSNHSRRATDLQIAIMAVDLHISNIEQCVSIQDDDLFPNTRTYTHVSQSAPVMFLFELLVSVFRHEHPSQLPLHFSQVRDILMAYHNDGFSSHGICVALSEHAAVPSLWTVFLTE